jgi:hypothetical protein
MRPARFLQESGYFFLHNFFLNLKNAEKLKISRKNYHCRFASFSDWYQNIDIKSLTKS